MDNSIEFNDQTLAKLTNSKYGTKETVLFYMKKARDASSRAKVAMSVQNPMAVGAEVYAMDAAIQQVLLLLNDTNIVLPSEK